MNEVRNGLLRDFDLLFFFFFPKSNDLFLIIVAYSPMAALGSHCKKQTNKNNNNKIE